MRLGRLELVSYGAFESLAVDIGPGLTVVHGPNESGKSTTAHALGDLLWGLRPRQHPYAFRVSPPRLLLRAETDDPNASDDPTARITFTVDSRGTHEADGTDLVPWWRDGPVDTRETWSTAFGLNLPQLRQGGHKILTDGGDLAGLLFQARTGIEVAAEIERLTCQSESLYKKHRGAKKVSLRELAAVVQARVQETERATSSAAQVVRAREEVDRLAAVRDAADRRFADREAERADAEEDRRAWTPAVELAAARQRQDRLRAQGRVFEQNELQICVEARQKATDLTRRIAEIDERLAALDTRLDALTVDPGALALAGSVEKLQGQKELQLRQVDETAEERSRLTTVREEIRALMRSLDPRPVAVGLDSPEELREAAANLLLPSDVSNRLHRASQELGGLTEEIRIETEEILDARRHLAGFTATEQLATDNAETCGSARAERDRAWQQLKDPWIAGDLPHDNVRAELARHVDDAVRAADEAADTFAARERLTGRTLEIDSQLAARTAHLEQLTARRDSAGSAWSQLLVLAGAPPALDPPAWHVRSEILERLAEQLDIEHRIRRTVAELEQAFAEFTREVSALGQQLALPEGDPWAVLSEANARVQQAGSEQKAAETLRREKDESLLKRDGLRSELAGYEAVTDRLRRAGHRGEGSTDTVDSTDCVGNTDVEDEDLDMVIERSRQLGEEQRRETECLEQLRHAARPGNDPEALADRVAGLDSVDLQTREDRATEALSGALGERDEARAALERARDELRDLERTGQAAVLHARQVEATEELLAQMAEYVRIKVMIAVLGRLLADEAPDHDTELLDHARRIVRRLTVGRITGLSVQDRDGSPGLRVEGEGLDCGGLPELSEGTADQVHLALRLAGIRQTQQRAVSQGHGTLPVLFDDILVSHDDARTALALEVLTEEARDQQIILLTHHRAVADAAQRVGATVTHLQPCP
ncbi:MAG: hypothetical protein QG608_2125 [Actinomycetota bacterium]|nr:hypothetical protein [Actinomycetota bacterium]